MDFLTGLLIEGASLLLIGGGVLIGWKARDAILRVKEPSVESPDEDDMLRMEAQQEAFKKLLNYSTETAYGLNKEKVISP